MNPTATALRKTTHLKQNKNARTHNLITLQTKNQKSNKKTVWPSGTYDPSATNNKITPISNYKGQFTLFACNAQDCPPGLYEKFEKIINTEPKIVGSKGEQGLKRASTWVKNNKGEIVPGGYKAKPLGLFGDFRIISFEEKSRTGETLHVFTPKNILFKAH